MSAPLIERIQVPGNPESSGLDQREEDVALEAIARHIYGNGEVVGYDAVVRKDYVGDASSKKQVDGELFVDVHVSGPAGIETRRLSEHDMVLSEEAVTKLGAMANRNWAQGKQWYRDYGRNS